MAKVTVQYTPIQAKGGKKVHAVTLRSPKKTACGRLAKGWVVSLKRINCQDCKLKLLHLSEVQPEAKS